MGYKSLSSSNALPVTDCCVCEMGKKRGGDKNSGLGKTILKERSRGKRTKGQSWVRHCLH